MSTTVSDYVNVHERLEKLRLSNPAPNDLVILPRGFETADSAADLAQESDASTLRKLFNEAGVATHQVKHQEQHFPAAVRQSAEWIAPTLFVGPLLLSQNPYAIQIALGVMESYIADYLRGLWPGKEIELSFVIEASKSKKCKKLTYRGPVSGIKEIAQHLRDLSDE